MKQLTEHLQAFFESFLAKRYKKQWLDSLERAKSESDIICGMDAIYRELDERFCIALPKGNKQYNIAFIRQAITPYKLSTCCVLSSNKNINGQNKPIDEALNAVVGSSSTTLIFFLSGRVVYLEGHSTGERYLCIKKA